jgi:hypothetical protein
VASGKVLAYMAGRLTAEEILELYTAYLTAIAGTTLENTDCLYDDLNQMGADTYADASLVLIPSGYSTGVVYGQRPLDSNSQITFTRASNATRVINGGLIEKVRTNLALYSEDQSSAQYVSVINEIANRVAVANPLTGQNNAYKITSTSGNDPYIGNIVGGLTNGENTFSLWLWTDAGQSTEATLFFYNTSATEVYFKALTITTTPTRYSFTVNFANVGASAVVRLDLRQTGAAAYLYTYGWQAESGVMTDYIATTSAAVSVGPVSNVPRIDYTGGGCGKLLLEPQRTNLVTFSEQFDNAGWGKTLASVTANTTLSPDGYQNADTFTPTSASASSSVSVTISSSAATHTMSVYAKVASGTKSFRFFRFNGTDGEVTSPTFTATTTWQRFTWTTTPSVATSTWYIANAAADLVPFIIYGAQLEVGAYATSYIPTLSTSVTRVADAAYKTGISSLIGQTEGTIFFEYEKKSNGTGEPIWLSDGTINNYILFLEGSNISFQGFVGGTQWNIASGTLSLGTHKVAAAYKQNDIVLYIDGVQIGTDTSANIPTCSLLGLGYENGTIYNNGNPYKQALLFKKRLSNDELASLTTL